MALASCCSAAHWCTNAPATAAELEGHGAVGKDTALNKDEGGEDAEEAAAEARWR